MIAKVQLINGEIAELDDDGQWRCEDELMRKLLQAAYNPYKEDFAMDKFNALASLMPLGYFTVKRMLKENVASKILEQQPLVQLPPGAIM